MKDIRTFSSYFLLLLFCFIATPKSLLHEFFHEHESSDITCGKSSEAQVERQHQHCELLQLNHTPLEFTALVLPGSTVTLSGLVSPVYKSHHTLSSFPLLFFRGPPSGI